MEIEKGEWSIQDQQPELVLSTVVQGKTMNLNAPIWSGVLVVDEAGAVFTLMIGIDKVKTGNFLLDAAVRVFLTSYGASQLHFVGSGHRGSDPLEVAGVATSGRVCVEMDLRLATGPETTQGLQIHLTGTAAFEEVQVPIPGIGRLDELVLTVESRFTLTSAH